MAPKKKKQDADGLVVLAISTAGSVVAAAAARRVLRVGWKAVTGETPPDDPKSRETDWMVALMWALASGAAIGVARMLAERELVGRISRQV